MARTMGVGHGVVLGFQLSNIYHSLCIFSLAMYLTVLEGVGLFSSRFYCLSRYLGTRGSGSWNRQTDQIPPVGNGEDCSFGRIVGLRLLVYEPLSGSLAGCFRGAYALGRPGC